MARIGVKSLASLCTLIVLHSYAYADDGEPFGRFASVFTDNAVLQRDSTVSIWGTASAGDPVRVEYSSGKADTKAGTNGTWSIRLPVGAASSGSDLKLFVRDRQADIKRNVAAGDVYLCSGQSNMQWPVSKALQPWINVPAADDPHMRLLHVKVRHSASPATSLPESEYWRTVTPQSVAEFSAVCYYFGKQLREAHPDVPVGLIGSARGGSKARAWLSSEKLAEIGGYERGLELNRLFARNPEAAQNQYQADPNLPHKMQAPWLTSHGPSVHYNQMIAPLAPYTLRGAAWYQGESDTGDPQEYARLLPALMSDWREKFANPDLPFFIVQLSALGERGEKPRDSGLLAIRSVQEQVVWADPHAALITTVDIGDPLDVHPTNKQEVGRRMRLAAERLVYKTRASGCDQRKITVAKEGKNLLATLPNACTIDSMVEAASPLGFQTCDAAGNCEFAKAELVDPRHIRIIPSAKLQASEIRFCWTPSPFCNLYVAEGEPLPPFVARVR